MVATLNTYVSTVNELNWYIFFFVNSNFKWFINFNENLMQKNLPTIMHGLGKLLEL